jgi:hypothetical protein
VAKRKPKLPAVPKPKGKPRGKAFEKGNAYAWAPGQSGNPNGTPGPKISTRLKEVLAMPVPADAKQALADLIAAGATFDQIIAFVAGLKASQGDLAAMAFISDRTEGALDQTINVNVTGEDLARAKARAKAFEKGLGGG